MTAETLAVRTLERLEAWAETLGPHLAPEQRARLEQEAERCRGLPCADADERVARIVAVLQGERDHIQ